MNYYTSQIPHALTEKLKAAGMYIEFICYHSHFGTITVTATYAEVLDWLMGKGINLHLRKVISEKGIIEWEWFVENNDDGYSSAANTWHEAAEKAIEKALNLI